MGDKPENDFVNFGDVARGRLAMRAKNAAEYVDGVNGKPKLGDGLRFIGIPSDFLGLKIHKDDIGEFVLRVENILEKKANN